VAKLGHPLIKSLRAGDIGKRCEWIGGSGAKGAASQRYSITDSGNRLSANKPVSWAPYRIIIVATALRAKSRPKYISSLASIGADATAIASP
jgi:hypothetical protein